LWSSRARRGHRGEIEFPPDALVLWNATDVWLLQNNEFRPLRRSVAGGLDAPDRAASAARGDRALHFLAFDLPRLRDAFDVRAGEGIRLPRSQPRYPPVKLRLAGTLYSVTGELMCSYGRPRAD